MRPAVPGEPAAEKPSSAPGWPPCPKAPCCVASTAAPPGRRLAPIGFSGPAPAARERLLAVLQALPRTRITAVGERSIRAECRSRLFGFVDDLEFRIDEPAGVIHFRAACRFGVWDLGVNRRRIERIRSAFHALEPAP